MVKDVVSGSGLWSLETNGFVEFTLSETLGVGVTEPNQCGRGVTMGRPLEFREHDCNSGGSLKIGRVL